MQLPRGTFREIKKGSRIGDLLEELERTKFSGISSISSPAGTGTLVYKKGACILVKFKGQGGDKGWGDLHADPDSEVDAALSTLDDAQIQLALDFNKTCRVMRPVRTADEQKRPAPSARPAPEASPAALPPRKPAGAASLFRSPAAAEEPPLTPAGGPAPASPRRPAMPAPPAMPRQTDPATGGARPQQKGGESADTSGQSSSFENDIDTFDTMDLDNVTDKIRNDCKTMIKQLHLEHLMER